MSERKRYAVCGVSSRVMGMYIRAILGEYKDYAELVGMLDIDPLRFQICKQDIPESQDVPCYLPSDFEQMLAETRPDALIVTCMDCFHVDYIIKGLEHGLDIIAEKPMTTNTPDALRVLEAEKKSRGKIICTFNYRYPPEHVKIKEMLLEGKIGRITYVDLNWYVDIRHGSSYFNRWNRMRKNSGSLTIHKSCHHFDLVNWWLDDAPVKVHAFGGLNHYGAQAPFKPKADTNGQLCSQCPYAQQCGYRARFFTRLGTYRSGNELMPTLSDKRQLYTNYRPEQCIFDREIDIYDTYIANVKYKNGALLNYSCNFSAPYEGYRLAINGTHGRIETLKYGGEAGDALPNLNGPDGVEFIDYFPIFGGRERISIPKIEGDHGGGDPMILEDIFLGEDPNRRFDILARSVDGLRAIAIGDAVYNCIHDECGEIDMSSYIL